MCSPSCQRTDEMPRGSTVRAIIRGLCRPRFHGVFLAPCLQPPLKKHMASLSFEHLHFAAKQVPNPHKGSISLSCFAQSEKEGGKSAKGNSVCGVGVQW